MASDVRALRKMIAKLAEMPAQERTAVLNRLDEAQSARVHELLDEYHGLDPSPLTPSPAIDRLDLPPGLSPWLVDLLAASGNATERDAAMPLTPDTLDALRDCAAELAPEQRAASGGAPKRRRVWQAIAERISVGRNLVGAQ